VWISLPIPYTEEATPPPSRLLKSNRCAAYKGHSHQCVPVCADECPSNTKDPVH
jgi:hypothetical protein